MPAGPQRSMNWKFANSSKSNVGQIPSFNCVLLGMGPDGHTASLFPGTSALEETKRLAVANWIEKFQSYRITLTGPLFNNADRILFLVGGIEKADTLKAVLEDDSKTTRFPVQLIQPTHGRSDLVSGSARGRSPESTTTRIAGGLDFTAIGGKRQGREVPQSLKTTRWNRVRVNDHTAL